jgi:hypothetical protein
MRLFACLLLLAACDDGPAPPLFDAGPRRDGGRPESDAGRMDGGTMVSDGGDAGQVVPTDAGTLGCVADPELIYKLGDEQGGRDRVIGLAAGGGQFAALWTELVDGRPDMFGVRMASDGTLGTPQRLTDNTSREQTPSIVAIGTSWLAAWTDNHETVGFEVRAQPLSTDVVPMGTITSLTATDTLLEEAPVLFRGSDGVRVAWLEQSATTTIRTRPLDDDGSPRGATATASSTGNAPLAFGELAAGPVALWIAGGHALLQRLTVDGAMNGAPIELDETGNASGTIDAAITASGGAVVFGALVSGVRREVRFRAIGPGGERLFDERILGEGSDASIADFAGGFAVSYRAVTATGVELRLALLGPTGDLIDEVTVTEVSAEGGRTTLRVSGDGQMAIAWGDRSTTSLGISLASIQCGAGL